MNDIQVRIPACEIQIGVEFCPGDMWIGLYWKYKRKMAIYSPRKIDEYICIIPMLPIHIRITL